jgi:hypothetical protein
MELAYLSPGARAYKAISPALFPMAKREKCFVFSTVASHKIPAIQALSNGEGDFPLPGFRIVELGNGRPEV